MSGEALEGCVPNGDPAAREATETGHRWHLFMQALEQLADAKVDHAPALAAVADAVAQAAKGLAGVARELAEIADTQLELQDDDAEQRGEAAGGPAAKSEVFCAHLSEERRSERRRSEPDTDREHERANSETAPEAQRRDVDHRREGLADQREPVPVNDFLDGWMTGYLDDIDEAFEP